MLQAPGVDERERRISSVQTPKVERSSSSLNSAYSSDAESFTKKLHASGERKAEVHPVASGSGTRAFASNVGASTSSLSSSSSASLNKVSKKRPSDPTQRSSAGAVFADELEPLDKKPKLAPEPGVLAPSAANALNAPQANPATALNIIRTKVDGLRAQIATLVSGWTALYQIPAAERRTDFNSKVQTATAKYGQMRAQLEAAETELRSRQQAEAYAALMAAGTAANAGPLAGDAMMGVMNGLSGAAMPGHADDSDDDEARLWGAVDAGMNQDELEQFVKGVCDSEGFEGNANVNNAATIIGLKNQQSFLPHMNIRLMPHQVRQLAAFCAGARLTFLPFSLCRLSPALG